MEAHPLLWLAILTLLAGIGLGYRNLNQTKREQEKGDTPASPAFGALAKSAEAPAPDGHPDPRPTNAAG